MNVQLKRLTENELELLMNWRMQPDITKMMLTDPVLTLEGQKKWFEKIKNDKSQIRWIIFSDNIIMSQKDMNAPLLKDSDVNFNMGISL